MARSKYVPSIGRKHSHRPGSFKRVRGRPIRAQQPNTLIKMVYRSNPEYYQRRESQNAEEMNPFVDEALEEES